MYSNFVWVLKPGELAATAVAHIAAFSGMDLDYIGRASDYLLGTAEQIAERISARLVAFEGVDHIVLNPLDWSDEQLELIAHEVLRSYGKVQNRED